LAARRRTRASVPITGPGRLLSPASLEDSQVQAALPLGFGGGRPHRSCNAQELWHRKCWTWAAPGVVQKSRKARTHARRDACTGIPVPRLSATGGRTMSINIPTELLGSPPTCGTHNYGWSPTAPGFLGAWVKQYKHWPLREDIRKEQLLLTAARQRPVVAASHAPHRHPLRH